MLGNILPPYHTLQELNLDWILTQIKNMLRFIPDDGSVGQILRRTAHGAEWSNEQGGGGGAVNSVNGQTGDVVLTASDVGALPDTTPIPTKTSDLNNDSGFITSAQAPVQSVNGQTGTVTLSIPTKTSDLNNDSGFITSAGAPVQSVNGQTGAVTLSIPTKTSDLNNDSGFVDAAGAAAAAPVQSVNGQTGAVSLAIPVNTSGSGYCKMDDGTLICWGMSVQRYTSTNAWGSGYVANFTTPIPFPVEFYDDPFVTVTNEYYGSGTYSGVCTRIENSHTGITIIQLMRLAAFSATTDHHLGWCAVGRWKA